MFKDRKRGNKGQVTIFIIIAVLIIVAIILFFLLRSQKISIFQPSLPSPEQEIEKCVKDSTRGAVNIMLSQAGFIQPKNYVLYKNNKVGYLCYTGKYYYPCVQQEPVYINHLEEEIEKYIQPKIKDCFYSLTKEYKSRNYQVNEGPVNLNVELRDKQVRIRIEKNIELRKNEKSEKYKDFNFIINSPLYNLAVIGQEIASQEAEYCNFEYIGYSLLYPSVAIEKKQVGSASTTSDIYKIKDKVTGKELLIAIRSCAMPGGL